jgi:hypothetical protein
VTVLAVDWSGRRSGEARHLWTAEATGGTLLALTAGRTRDELVDDLVARLDHDPSLVVGFDFSFSLPAWFLDAQGWAAAPDLWDAAASRGEHWLRECAPPFWGRTGRTRPPGQEQLRRTEAGIAAVGGIRPKSTFQIGGAGSVGTGSVRGFPALARLHAAGFTIWPFDAPALPPVAIEIYPRALTGAVVKRDPAARRAYLDTRYPALPRELRDLASGSEDAFDAAVSALVMSLHEPALRALPALDDAVLVREGWVWTPASAPELTPAAPPVATG